MNKILYFPYISIPKGAWLTSSILYWDKVASIVPYEFIEKPHKLDKYMRSLVELELIEQIIPEQYTWRIHKFEDSFLEMIDRNPVFHNIAALNNAGLINPNGVIKDTIKIHLGKLESIGEKLMERGLAWREGWSWFVMDSYTGNLFMTYLATVIGQETDFIPSTDSYDGLTYLLPVNKRGNPRQRVQQELYAQILPDIFPLPDQIGNPYELYRFKEKYNYELLRLRRYVESFILDLELIPETQRKDRIKIFVEDINDEVGYITDRMRSFHWRNINFTTICSIASSAIPLINAANTNDSAKAIESTPGLINTIYSLVNNVEKREIQRKPLAYAAIARKRFGNRLSRNSSHGEQASSAYQEE
ncbi:hypothetical protein [Paenibacillus hamazuiensis]|uniref:hypothetical protein n=1 Tax=Paenibacillus hamazuiensis TaxID=2936508 RepID=UPI00200C5524|nr:hypothetical protein [Paenibacillus hamazuiensis]